MRIYEILFENIWSDVATKWSAQDKIGVDDVTNTINIFRQLANTGKITGTNEKNIQYWSKKLFSEFQSFVDENKHKLETKGTARQVVATSMNAITLYDYDDWIAFIPLDKPTSQNLGSGTKWCTATKSDNNMFNEYVFTDLTTLIYLISEMSTAKYAIRFTNDTGEINELVNSNNNELTSAEFIKLTACNPHKLVSIARGSHQWAEFAKNALLNNKKQILKKLINSAKNGDVDNVKFCLTTSLDYDDLDAALQSASEYGHNDVVKLLLKHGAKSTHAGWWAVKNHNMSLLKLLIDHGAVCGVDDNNALNLAVEQGEVDMTKMLIDHGACPLETDALVIAADAGQLDMVIMLAKYVNISDEICKNAMIAAIYKSHLNIIKYFLSIGVDPNSYNGVPLAAATSVTSVTSVDIIKLLLKYGANVNARRGEALWQTCNTNKIDILHTLLDYDADIHARGDAAFLRAVELMHSTIVHYLLNFSITKKQPYSMKTIQQASMLPTTAKIQGILQNYLMLLDK